MDASKLGCAGQAVALATGNDSGEKKSRIRRSKEERKSMVESFIQRYQTSNNGHFPSLNLTHKEVGGSFYTVREIVREIIQENRVLAPPKLSLEEHGLSECLEQHPLGSISMEPLINLSVSDIGDEIQFSSSENISTSRGSYPLELNHDEQAASGGYELADKYEDSNRLSESHHALDHYQDKSVEEVSNSAQSKSPEIEENIVKAFEAANGSPHFDKPPRTTADHYDGIDKRPGSQMLNHEQHHIKNDQIIDTEPTVMETLDQGKIEAQNVETPPAIKSHTNFDVVVETFPLRPVSGTVNSMAEESGKDDETFSQSSSSIGSEEGDRKPPHSTVELNGENRDAKVLVNLQDTSIENALPPSATKPSVLNGKASSSTKTSISEDSATVGEDNGSVAKGNNPTLDRINLETWDGAAKKSTQPETNPLLALVKAVISSFVKFWTE